MLELGSKTITVDGVTVFADHADPDQFWVLPAEVKLARRGDDDQPQFTLIKYAQEAVEGGVEGGGFLMFEVNLRLDPELERRIRSRVAGLAEGTPRIAQVPYDEGSVEVIALNLQGGGGTAAEEPPGPAAFVAVEEIMGATVPSLRGDNSAAFSLTLSEEGAQILEDVFRGGGQPVGVIYDLKFTGLRPALKVEITADFERIYNHFSTSLDVGAGFPVEGVPVFIRADIDAAFETLRQEGVIEIKVIDFSSAEDRQKKESWALEFFKNHLLADWFKPTLQPIKFDEDSGSSDPLGQLSNLISNATGGEESSGGNGGDSNGESSGGNGDDSGSDGGTGESEGGNGNSEESGGGDSEDGGGNSDGDSEGNPGSDGRQPAQLQVQSTSPSPLPDGYAIEHTPAETGTTETLTFSGGEEAPTVRVNGEEQSLSDRSLTVAVAPGETAQIEAVYPAVSEERPRFHLYFDFDLPDDEGWETGDREIFEAYLNDNVDVHGDAPFSQSDGSELPYELPPGPLQGAAALRSWSQGLPEPQEVTITARASFEGIPEKDEHNQELSERRLEVAKAIVSPLVTVTETRAEGDDHHQELLNDSGTDKPPEAFRVAIIEGPQPEGEQQVTIQATLTRPEADEPEDDGENGEGADDGEEPEGGNGGEEGEGGDNGEDEGNGGNGGNGQMGVSVAFKLRVVEQEELKRVTLRYNRAEAVQQRYAPQGFFGLLVEELDESQHFFNVSLNDPFFREFVVSAEVPIDFEQIALTSVHVALDYGDPSDPDNHAHDELEFDHSERGPKEALFLMNDSFDTSYIHQVQYHFDPQSGFVGERFTYELPEQRTEDRTLLINPFEQLGFMEIEVAPGEIDPGIVEKIDVHLAYEDPGSWQTEEVFQVTADSEPQLWQLRLSDRNARTYTYRLVHHLSNGTTRETGPESSQTTALTVDDPFVDALELTFETLLLDPEEVKMVFVDVEYEDPDNDYRRQENLRIPGDTTEAQQLRIALLDPEQRTYRYRLTFVSPDNEVRREPFVTTEETRILIGEA